MKKKKLDKRTAETPGSWPLGNEPRPNSQPLLTCPQLYRMKKRITEPNALSNKLRYVFFFPNNWARIDFLSHPETHKPTLNIWTGIRAPSDELDSEKRCTWRRGRGPTNIDSGPPPCTRKETECGACHLLVCMWPGVSYLASLNNKYMNKWATESL